MKATDSNSTPILGRIKNLGAALLLSLLFGCGGGGGGGGGGTSAPNFALLAGNMGGSGHEDGAGAAVQLDRPPSLVSSGTARAICIRQVLGTATPSVKSPRPGW